MRRMTEAVATTTKFQDLVYARCSEIPKGKVSTYKYIAKQINGNPRAVGSALRRNPYAPRVPCHRVVAHDLSIGGFQGCTGTNSEAVRSKKKILEEEGVEFEPGTFQIKQSCLYTFSEEPTPEKTESRKRQKIGVKDQELVEE